MTTTDPDKTVARSPELAYPHSPWNPWWWVAGVFVLAVFVFLLRPADPTAELFEARRQQIETMSQSERDRLQQNLARFQDMSPEQQDRLRAIQEIVTENEGLQTTLQQYQNFLKTLSPWERLELREASSVEAKLHFVSTIAEARRQEAEELRKKAEESSKEEQFWQELLAESLSKYQPDRKNGGSIRITDNEVSDMIAVLEDDFGPRVKVVSSATQGCAAYSMQLLAEALRANMEENEEEARENPLSRETIDQMVATLDSSESRAMFRNTNPKFFVNYLVWKLDSAWWNEARQNPPTPEELEEIEKNLGGKVQEDFEKLKSREPRLAFFVLLRTSRLPSFKEDTKDLYDVLQALDLRNSSFRPPGSGRPPGSSRFGEPGSRGGQSRGSDRERGEFYREDRSPKSDSSEEDSSRN